MRRAAVPVLEPSTEQAPAPPWGTQWSVAGVIDLLEPLVLPRRRERLAEVAARRIGSVTVVLDAPHDPHNAAAILRSCEAFGLRTVHVVRRAETFRASRAVTRGAERWVDLRVHATPERALAALREPRFSLVAAHPDGALLPADLGQFRRLALLFGNEHDGIRESLARHTDASVRIPMRGFVESLNLSVAAALLLEAATRNRSGDLSEAQQRELYARALLLSVPRSRELLAASEPR